MSAPYPPGVWDIWDNVFLLRSASHVWNAQRNMAALIGAGVLDRYPELRLAPLEGGHGWLASWAARLDELAEMCRHALPPLERKPSDYVRGPQYFQSIQMHEGEQSVRHAIEALGEDTLMFATDYPHSESWFPKSVDTVLGWTSLPETAKRKLLWDNALRCYRRYGARVGA
jgi:predicted TIM-barrel fold metal-dependent hydrolase